MNGLEVYAAIAVWVSLMVFRPTFLRTMAAARRSDLQWLAWEIELLAADGRISKESALYLYYGETARSLGSNPFQELPGLLQLAVGFWRWKPTPEILAFHKQIDVELTGQYQHYAYLTRRIDACVLDLLGYRSILVWLGTRVLEQVRGVRSVRDWLRQSEGQGPSGDLRNLRHHTV